MRRFFISVVLALGSVAVWAAMPPPATQPVTTSPAMSKALFLCHRQQGVGQTCVAALVNALVIEQSKQAATATADRTCHVEPRSQLTQRWCFAARQHTVRGYD
jgi:hypothetical protein